MKKIISLSLALLIAFSLAFSLSACKGSGDDGQPVLTTRKDSGSLDDEVKIVVPLFSIDEKYQNDLDGLCEAYGYSSAKLNKRDETVTITTNAFRHKLLLTRIGMRVIKAIYDLEEDKKYPYLVSVDEINDDDFSSATITVKKKSFQDLLPYVIGQDLLLYKMYEGSGNYDVSVIVKDEKGNLIEEFHYSDKDK